MIIDGRQAIGEAPAECDVLIVGGGPAGITLAMELMGSGLRIVLIESGGLDFDDRAQALNDGRLTALDTTDLTAARLRMLGGATSHWGGQCLPLDPIDFARAPPGGLTGWPVTREAMIPFYETASAYCELGAFDYGLDAVEGLEPGDRLLPDEPRLRTELIRQSPPTDFGTRYRAGLEAARDVQVRLWTTATGLEIDADGVATGAEIRSIDGRAGRIAAGEVVLACGAVENARLLLDHNARAGRSLGDRGGLLGRCYMDHPVGGAGFLHFDAPVTAKANWSRGLRTRDGTAAHLVWRLADPVLEAEGLLNAQFYVIPLSADAQARRARADAERGLAGLKSVAKWTLGRDRDEIRLSGAYCDFVRNADALAVHALGEATGGERVERALLRYEIEQRPDRASYVALDPTARDAFGQPLPVLHWSPTLEDRASLVRSTVLIGTIAGANGLGRVELEDHFDERYWDAHTAWHQMGTTRMAQTERMGVVDPDGLLFGTRNVHVAGGSVFPTGGRANPTMTIVALAARLAGHLDDRRGA